MAMCSSSKNILESPSGPPHEHKTSRCIIAFILLVFLKFAFLSYKVRKITRSCNYFLVLPNSKRLNMACHDILHEHYVID
jgi:hypothetical protein